MEALEQLEACVDDMLARQDKLKRENLRLQTEISSLAQEKAVLEEKNHSLHAMLAQQDKLRAEALQRIESLLRKIQDHDSVG